MLEREVEQATLLRDPGAVLDVEFGLAERGGDLVLHHLHPHAVADRLRPLLERLDPADVEALRGIELERPPAGLGLRRVVHHHLIDEVGVIALDLEVVSVLLATARRLAVLAANFHRRRAKARP